MTPDLFDHIVVMPNQGAADRFEALVGLDVLKSTILKQVRIIFIPDVLERWSEEKHGKILPCVEQFRRRPQLMVFHGDVGTGKTTLADSLGDPIARDNKIAVTLARLSLTTRGQGVVGQMTELISRAFDEVAEMAKQKKTDSGKPTRAVVFVIDEADALAESRNTEQMHHEDRAGVNALIRGIDRLAQDSLPVLVILCTNRYRSLDPAVLRRAAITHEFERPNTEQSEVLFRRAFDGIFDDGQYSKLAELAGPNNGRNYGHSFSDITQRLIPRIVLEAFPDKPIDFETARSVIGRMEPTRPFGYEDSNPGT